MGIKRLLERATGYWVHNADYLPVGVDLRVDLERAGIDPQVVFDVGANVGQTYRRFRRDFPSSRIVSFEPIRRTFDALAAEVEGDMLAKAEHLALGDEKKVITIGASEEWSLLNSLAVKNHAPDLRAEVVTVDTVDSYCARNGIRRIDLLKIDTEGFEIEVLRGATESDVLAVLCEVGFDSENERNTFLPRVMGVLQDFSFHALYDVTHYPQRMRPSFANALFLHDRVAKAKSS